MNYITNNLQSYLKQNYNLELLNYKDKLIKAFSDILLYRIFNILAGLTGGAGVIVNIVAICVQSEDKLSIYLLLFNIAMCVITTLLLICYYSNSQYQKLHKIRYVLENIL
jgi:hypothetical protein